MTCFKQLLDGTWVREDGSPVQDGDVRIYYLGSDGLWYTTDGHFGYSYHFIKDPVFGDDVHAYIFSLGKCAARSGYPVDSCSTRATGCYSEAVLVSCQLPSNVIAGQVSQVAITVNQGSVTENYKLVFTGDFVGESAPFTVNAGTGQQQFTVGNLIFTTGGAKNVTASLVKA